MAGVLGCPAAPPSPRVFTVQDACQKLVGCGVLAGDYVNRTGPECTDNNSCTTRPGGECLPHGEGHQCFFPFLDYSWCVHRLSALAELADPCDRDQHPGVQAVQQALDCISVTKCPALGLSFIEKRKGREERSEKDKYICSDQTKVWTATICDAGLLSYDLVTPPQN